MFSVQRYVLYFVLAACILISLNYYRAEFWAPFPHTHLSPTGGTHLQGGSGNKKFQWRTVPTYPVTSLTPLPTDKPLKLPKIQYDFPVENQEHATKRKERQAAVRRTFKRSWEAYRSHAWMEDELAPISGSSKNGFGGWGASLVDNLDNLWIMGFKEEFEHALSAAMNIDLTSATIDSINVFETTIRHLGGFLAAYDLSGDERCLHKATEFGEMLYKAFDTPNRMPITRWKLKDAVKGKQEADKVVLLAELGSFTMEFTRLSILTGDSKFYDAVDRITRLLAEQQDKTHLPGMWPVVVNARVPDLTMDTWFTLGAMADSTYEVSTELSRRVLSVVKTNLRYSTSPKCTLSSAASKADTNNYTPAAWPQQSNTPSTAPWCPTTPIFSSQAALAPKQAQHHPTSTRAAST
jgi:mannosyl-oligosaccharide alpha-1,2-mannosidase